MENLTHTTNTPVKSAAEARSEHLQKWIDSQTVQKNPMVQIKGNTYPVKGLMWTLGGMWNKVDKCWEVPSFNAETARAAVAHVEGLIAKSKAEAQAKRDAKAAPAMPAAPATPVQTAKPVKVKAPASPEVQAKRLENLAKARAAKAAKQPVQQEIFEPPF